MLPFLEIIIVCEYANLAARLLLLKTSYLTFHFDMKLPEQVLQFTLKRAHVLEKTDG